MSCIKSTPRKMWTWFSIPLMFVMIAQSSQAQESRPSPTCTEVLQACAEANAEAANVITDLQEQVRALAHENAGLEIDLKKAQQSTQNSHILSWILATITVSALGGALIEMKF